MIDFVINGLEFRLTCYACPEQYDVYSLGKQIGYCRLRHGRFTVTYPDVGGVLVYSSAPSGDGCFEEHERYRELKKAAKALTKQHIKHQFTNV
jgi:hypothetical protein